LERGRIMRFDRPNVAIPYNVKREYGWQGRFTEIAIASLQALIERRPELIGTESSERSRRLLLGLP